MHERWRERRRHPRFHRLGGRSTRSTSSRATRTVSASWRSARIATSRSSPSNAGVSPCPTPRSRTPAAAARLEGELRAREAPTRVHRRRRSRWSEIASLPEVHSVMAAIVGAAGLRSTLAAARAGKRLLLANKESLVMAGPLLMQTVRAVGRHAAAHRQRTQRGVPVPAARRALRRSAAGRETHPADRLGRSVPRRRSRAPRARHAR